MDNPRACKKQWGICPDSVDEPHECYYVKGHHHEHVCGTCEAELPLTPDETSSLEEPQSMTKGWIGFDLDGTLAIWETHRPIDQLGAPIKPMVDLLKGYLDDGISCKIVTARVAASNETNSSGVHDSQEFANAQRKLIEAWCLEHIGVVLPVTASKDFAMLSLYDDRVISVMTNTGIIATEAHFGLGFQAGQEDARSRSRSRPSDGDMGG